MDDIWSINVWDKVKFFFPDNNNGSRIMITTRLTNLALHISGTSGLEMSFLDEDKSWNLLCKNVFGEKSCPIELEKVGMKIAKNCEGLPLSIVAIGGLLARSKQTREYWEYIADNLNEIVNLDDNEHCLKVLYASYNQLPIHLKPCFLYMGMFREDSKIFVSELIKLWVAEGFLKPITGKSLEEVAEEYLKNLIDRNLILVSDWKSDGQIKSCNIHDLLRDLCLREAEKDKFFSIIRLYGCKIPRDISTERRIAIHECTSKVLYALGYESVARSLICNFERALPLLNYKLLRVLKAFDRYSIPHEEEYSLEGIFQLVNSRYLAIKAADWGPNSRFPSSFNLLWNLQTLVIESSKDKSIVVPEIWKMSQLRHVEIKNIYLTDLPCSDGGDDEDFVLGNLQTLLRIENFKCGEEVVKRIPNIKKLQICYDEIKEGCSWSHYDLKNLGHLHKLESLCCIFPTSSYIPRRTDLLQNLSFPHSLKKLTLFGSYLKWDDMATKIGSLLHLEVLKLMGFCFRGRKWETVEGQFCNLKFLLIALSLDLQYWVTDSTHFPRLERLCLVRLNQLKKIPWEIGEIPTLQSIELSRCKKSLIISAKKILEEQKGLGNEGLKVDVLNVSSSEDDEDKDEDEEDEDEDEDDEDEDEDEDDKDKNDA